jgi:hypothetical protein
MPQGSKSADAPESGQSKEGKPETGQAAEGQQTSEPGLTHRVAWILEGNGDGPYGKIMCIAEVGANCRLGCPHGCSTWPCRHGDEEDLGMCNAAEWFSQDGVADCYIGTEHAPMDGPVIVEWVTREDFWGWRYPTPKEMTAAGYEPKLAMTNG